MSARSHLSIGRAGAWIAAGTLLSRATGVARTVVLVWVIGSVSSAAADAFTVANQLPNSLFTLLSVGVFSAVIVPSIARARSDGFVSKLMTLGGTLLLAATALAGLVTPSLVALQLPDETAQQSLAIAFALWCVPQLFFYGVYALVGETLNAHGTFGPHAWAPIANNVVTIALLLMFAGVFGSNLVNVAAWSAPMIALLGGVATLGIVVQALVVCAFWRRTGLVFRLDFGWRGVGFRAIGYTAGWTLSMALVSLAASFVQNRIVNSVSGEASAVTVMSNAWLVFMLPFALTVVAIGTPYFTRFSKYAAEGDRDALRGDFARSIRLISILTAGALAAVVAAAVPASRIFTTSAGDAAEAAVVLHAYLVGLLPLAINYVVLRVFYAHGDTRRPFVFTALQCTLVVAGAIASSWLVELGALPETRLAASVALVQSVASTIQAIVTLGFVRRYIGPLELTTWLVPLLRSATSAVPAAGIGWWAFHLLGGTDGWTTSNPFTAAAGASLVAGAALVVYAAALAVLRSPELGEAWRAIRRRSTGA